MDWRTQGLCPGCGQRLPVSTAIKGGLSFEGHVECSSVTFRSRKAPAEPFNRLYPMPCVSRFLGDTPGNLSKLVERSNIEHKIIRIGNIEIKCITFEEILRHSADCIAKPAWKGCGLFIATSRNRVFRRLDDCERLCYEDSVIFKTIWQHQEKENYE